jgi:hypothetical protein
VHTETPPSPLPVASGPAGYLVVAGGPSPEANEVSIERDAALARSVLGGHGQLLFAGGPGTRGVQVRDASPRLDPLVAELADIFAPRHGRDAHYAAVTVAADGPATRAAFEAALRGLVGAEGPPLLLALHGHGEQGERPQDGKFVLWGNDPLSVVELADALDRHARRGVRLVATSCFSGGFAELVFDGGLEASGLTTADRCGLFASPWDLEAAGCDPDPDVRGQSGYGRLFWNAVAGRDADGAALEAAAIDFDRDGKVSLLEAHARVRIASDSADVPTTTSERFLRFAAPADGPSRPVDLPEERAVIEALSRRSIGSKDMPAERIASATADLDDVEQAIADAEGDLDDAAAQTVAAWSALTGRLLATFPAIDDPWHPDFASTLESGRGALATLLHDSPEADAYTRAVDAEARLSDFVHQRRLLAAPLERLTRAVQTVALAGRLRAAGGAPWARYERLLACERFVPR